MDMPLNKGQSILAANWLETNFGDKMNTACQNTPFSRDIIISIALQESAQDWLPWIHAYTPEQILPCIISDPTGDQAGTSRNVWPQNLSAFKLRYPELSEMLVNEGNKFRAMPHPNYSKGWSRKEWLYKAYGIFQYDIQAIEWDKEFFAEKQWYSFDECLKRLMVELSAKYKIHKELWAAVKGYNGAGQHAEEYKNNVKQFNTWIG